MGTLTHDKYYIIALKEKNTLELPVSYAKSILGHMLCTFLFHSSVQTTLFEGPLLAGYSARQEAENCYEGYVRARQPLLFLTV